MKILHTSDWHVGKVLKGRDRHDEHAAALGSIVRTARDEDVDVVLIAGDLFETAAPNARAQGLVMRTLLALREDGRQVVAIAGNHDNQNLLDAVYRPVLGQLGLHVLGLPKRPGQGGTIALRTRGGETANVAALPFLSHRYAVRAAEVLLHEFAEHTLDYARQVAAIVALLTEGFTGGRGQRGDGARDPARRAARRRRARRADQPRLRAAGQHVPADRALRRRSATCTGTRRSPGPARSSTPARRWPSTSARRTTSRRC